MIKNIAGGTPYGDPYHGYWPQDIYSLNSAFGTPADLKALSTALHSRGMYLMVDTVANHMAYNGAPANVKYSTLTPFNDAKYYHPYCPMDHNDMNAVQKCWVGDKVVSLPDLKTEDQAVQSMFNQWIPQLVRNYSIDGLRLDSAMQVQQEFWPSFVAASGVYAIGEVFDGNPVTFCTYQNYMPGALNYPMYFWVLRAFQSTSATMNELANNVKWLNYTCKDTTLLGNFLENHDNPRFASITNDTGLTRNAIAFTLFNDGLPIVYYGQEQGFSGNTDPYNREPLWTSGYNTKTPMYTFISKLNAARSTAIARDPTYVTSKSNVIYSDDKTLVMSKGAVSSPLISVFTNLGAGKSSSITVSSKVSGLAANTKLTDLLTCTVVSTDSSGNLAISISEGAPRAFYKSSMLKASDPCASTSTGGMASSSTAKVSSTSTTVRTTARIVSTSSSSTTAASSSTAVTCPASNSTTYTSNGKSFIVECGIDHAGGDLSMVYVNGLKQCIETCAATSGCVNVALSGTACYMKSKIGSAVYNGVQGARLVITAPTTASSTTKTASLTTSSCTPSSTVAVSFNLNVTTAWLESIKLTGSLDQLGNWSTSQGVTLSDAGYTSDNPVWNTTVRLPAGTYLEYKFIKVDSNGAVSWETGSNRNYTVPVSCAGTAILSSSWKS